MDEKPKKIIIKKVHKGHAAHHGGSWKVAYADFVTGMMAFFLLMWLLSMVSPEKKAVLSLYFKHFTLFEKGGQSFMLEGGPKLMSGPKAQGAAIVEGDDTSAGLTKEELKGLLQDQVNKKLESESKNIIVDISKNGIRIQIIDTEGKAAFPPGSAQLTDMGKKILRVIAETTRGLPHKVVVEGHTDASPAKGEQASNWELSAARACAARRELELNGTNPGRIERVVGFADRAPLIEDNPSDPRNRRISIIFLFPQKERPAGSEGKNIYDLLDSRY
jgi:chemotaxis protein MotB